MTWLNSSGQIIHLSVPGELALGFLLAIPEINKNMNKKFIISAFKTNIANQEHFLFELYFTQIIILSLIKASP